MLIASGRFVGMLPSSVAHFNGKRAGLKTLPVKLPPVRLAASIVTVKNRTLSPAAKLFIDCARQVIKPISSTGGGKHAKSANDVPC
jgi:DNA-binding transcriptional LysR family regulator